jgi:integrase
VEYSLLAFLNIGSGKEMKGCRALTEEEVELLRATMINPRDIALFMLGVRSGLRISELLSLKVGDVYRHGHVVDFVYLSRKHVKKKVEGRIIPVHTDAKSAIEVLIDDLGRKGYAKASMPLFQSRKGRKAISSQHVRRILRDAAESNAFDGRISTHSMRKTFATRVYEKVNGDILKTQRALGHKSVASTMAYLSISDEEVFLAILGV